MEKPPAFPQSPRACVCWLIAALTLLIRVGAVAEITGPSHSYYAPAEHPQPNTDPGRRFGSVLAVAGKYMVVGAPLEDSAVVDAGAAYVFDTSSATPTVPVAILRHPSPRVSEMFGATVAISGSRIAIGCEADSLSVARSGRVYIYNLASATPTIPEFLLENPFATAGDLFGRAVALSDATLVVSAPGEDFYGSDSGMIFVFDLAAKNPKAIKRAIPRPAGFNSGSFGDNLSMSGTIFAVGGPLANGNLGRTFVYDLNAASPHVPSWVLDNPTPAPGDNFGSAVAVVARRVVVGADGDDDYGSQAGTAYVYDLDRAMPTSPAHVLFRDTITTGESFGGVLATAGSRVAVGAKSDRGRVWLYDLTGDLPGSPIETVLNPNASPDDSGDGFGRSLALATVGLFVGAPQDDLIAYNNGAVHFYALPDNFTEEPRITLPVSGEMVPASVNVRFILPEAALPGSVRVIFSGDNGSTTLILTDSFLAAGEHEVHFDSQAPTSSSDVASTLGNGSVPDGVYSVTVSYRDALGNPRNDSPPVAGVRLDATPPTVTAPADMVAEATSSAGAKVTFPAAAASDTNGIRSVVYSPDTGEVFPLGITVVTVTATDMAGNSGSTEFMVNVQDTTAPTITPPAAVKSIATSLNGAAISYSPAFVFDAVGVESVSYSPESGTVFPLGTTPVIVTARDAAGNESSTTFNVTVRLAAPAHEIFAQKGAMVPSDDADPRLPTGVKWTLLGPPTLSDAGDVAFHAKWSDGSQTMPGAGIFKNGILLSAARDAEAPLLFKSFRDPVFGRQTAMLIGQASLVGPGVLPKNDTGLFSFDPAETRVAREGDLWPSSEGVEVASIAAASTVGEATLVIARLRGFLVNGTNNRAAFLSENGNSLPIIRTGQDLLGKKVKHFRMLSPIAGSPGNGRGELNALGVRFIAAFTDQSEAIVEWSAPDVFTVRATTGEQTGSAEMPEAKWKSFGAGVSSAADGGQFAFLATLQPGVGEALGAVPRAIFLADEDGVQRVAEVGGGIPGGANAIFSTLDHPVLSADGSCLAFAARVRAGAAVTPCILAQQGSGALRIVTTLATPPAGVPAGARWKAFQSLAAPGGGLGPLFTAALRVGPGGVTAANDLGVWAVDSTGALRAILREGDSIAGKTLRTFRVLRAEPASPGVTREFNDQRELVWQATFTDGTTGVVKTTLP